MLVPAQLWAADAPAINLRQTIVVEVAAKAKSAVVNIAASRMVTRRVSPFAGDPFFQQFDIGQVVKVPANSLGSAFIVHEDGYVVTNNHVVDRAREITVELADGRKLPAELISADAEADLAVLKISDKKPFPTIELGDSSDLMIGEPAIAIGNPMGYSHSVSTGIISALHRDLKDQTDHGALKNLIQTDAAINPGNSGGPLLNAYGQVIGINTAIRSDAQNIGFAIPVNLLRDLIPELMSPAHAKKLELDIKLTEVRTLAPPATVHCQVQATGKTPRLVAAINGRVPRDIIDAYAQILDLKAGQNLMIRWADDQTEKLTAKALPLPDAIVQAKRKLGLTIEQLTPMLADKYHISEEDGLLINAVAKDSIAAKAGLEPGDVIVQLGRYRVSTLDDLASLLDRLPESGQVRIGVIRNDQMGFGKLDFGPAR